MPRKKNTDISEKQREVLAFIRNSILERGFPPTVREIGKAVGLSSSATVYTHLKVLEKFGYIQRDAAKSRTIEIVDDRYAIGAQRTVNVPIVGQVAAGQPILAEQNINGYYPFPTEALSSPDASLFMLEVRGDSMINIGILNGDYVICVETPTALNGQIVVALVDDSATVKRFFKENGHYRLQPENDSMDPIIVDDCQILGRVIALVRTM